LATAAGSVLEAPQDAGMDMPIGTLWILSSCHGLTVASIPLAAAIDEDGGMDCRVKPGKDDK
jgi:hypothetical protein